MLVVADGSPLIVMISIGQVEILPKLFGRIIVPPEVSAKLKQANRTQVVREFMTTPPAWLIEQAPTNLQSIPSLHAGEIAAISLAQELKADLLLIDDVQGRKEAAARKIPLTGTIGVIELSASRGLLDLADAFERVKTTDFWISHKLLDERLKRFLSAKGRG
jgi:predicted nucleic acid-binding protein